MDAMDIDSPPPDPNPLCPRDRILRNLAELGVPKEFVDRECAGIVDFLQEDPSRLPELVSAILPADVDVEVVLRGSRERTKKTVGATMKNRYRECMLWLEWMMFLGEPAVKLKVLSKMSSGRGVCGTVWGNNDIAYRCRTCENDPTCAICVPCFQNGNHKDHDFSVIYTGGGCCDCGDATAWKREGFCSKHRGAEQIQPLPAEFASSVEPVLDTLLGCWKDKLVAAETVSEVKVNDGVTSVMVKKKAANELTFAVVELLLEFCKFSESLLSFVSKRVIAVDGLLEILVKAERFLSDGVVKKLHELLLKLLAEPKFKSGFAEVFLGYYPIVVQEAIKENNDIAFKKYPLLSTFSVQILTVPTLTPWLVKERNLLGMLLGCLGDIFLHCAGEDGRLQSTKWGNLYETTLRVVDDIKFVMTHGIVPKYVTHEERDILRTWMKLLSFLQGMSPMKRETGVHIEEESEHINLPFFLGHFTAHIHSLLVDGAFSIAKDTDDDSCSNVHKQNMGDEDNRRLTKVGRLSLESAVSTSMVGRSVTSNSDSKVTEVISGTTCHPSVPPSVSWLTYVCLRTIENSFGADDMSGDLLSRNNSNISSSNFLALKKTLSKIRKGKSIFGGLGTSTKDHVSGDMDMENAESMGQDSKTMVTGEASPAALSVSSMEVDSFTEFDSLRALGLADWPVITYDVSSQDISVHIPLHRLLSLLLQRALKRCYGELVALDISSSSTSTPSPMVCDDFFGRTLRGCHPCGFSAFVMEHPLRNRVFCAQVYAGMWRKNGDSAILSCEWYRSVRWSEQGLELDLFLLQCCAALAPPDLFIKRIVDRFGLSDYFSLIPGQSSEYESVLAQEMLVLIIQIIQERRFSGLTSAENLKRELIHKLAIGDATRSQLVKSLPRDLSKIDQLQEVLDTVAAYCNPSGFNQGMYSLRWEFWKELDLFHPRWNPIDLQVAEERYVRHCSVSAWTCQLPKWTKIYPPLKGVARIATCEVVLQIIRAVLFYAVFTNRSAEMRAPDGLVLTALHLLSLVLEICFQQRESTHPPVCSGDSFPILAFAGEEICEGLSYGAGEQSLLSLLVSMMRMHKRENLDNSVEAGSCNFSSLIESLLKKFAEMDSGCMSKLQRLAPELVVHLSQTSSSTNTSSSTSDSEKRKAKARERQAAVLAKMKAEQSKFLSSINSSSDEDSDSGAEEGDTDNRQDSEESAQDVCSLCHDPFAKRPVSFLVLLQKSRLLSFIDRGPLSWNQVRRSNKQQVSVISNKVTSGSDSSTSGTGVISSSQLSQLLQNIVNEFAEYAQPGEVNAIVEFVKARFPPFGNTQVPPASKDLNGRASYTLERLEQEMYSSILQEMQDNKLISSSIADDENLSATEAASNPCKSSETALLGKYMAALSKELKEHPSASESSRNDDTQAESTSQLFMRDGFGPVGCDGVHLSSCGHAVHQGCLDRYLSSLKERFVRQIVFEGGHIVDPDQGEFLCPVCRRLANSVLPSLPGYFQKAWKQPMISSVSSLHMAAPSSTLSESNLPWFHRALSLLKSTAKMVEKGDILKNLPSDRNERLGPNLDGISHLLCKLYFSNRQDNFSGSVRINQPIILWDTLKYSLISMEVATRCGRTCTNPTYDLPALYRELKSSSGFTLLLLLTIVESFRNKDLVSVLQRLMGVQLFAESICFGASAECINSTYKHGGNISCILKNFEKEVPYPDMQFWSRATDPVLVRDAFSTLMWVLFCLPQPFLSCGESLLSLVHLFYVVSVAQAIILYSGKYQCNIGDDSLITDISKCHGMSAHMAVGEFGWISQYFVSNYDPASDIMEAIRRLSFPYLRRCALLWKLLSTSVSAPFCNGENELHRTSHGIDDTMDDMHGGPVDLNEVQELEKMFKIPPLDVVLKDKGLRSLVSKWLHHFCKSKFQHPQHVLHIMPAIPFKLMDLPHLYQDLLLRYIKQRCPDCKEILDEPALCLLCGRLCSPNWKSCCRDSGCQTHAMACGAGTGVFLLIKRTTILLQRCARQAPWPSPYLDSYGEEDVDMLRGKPLYLNEERYAALTYMVASHGLDRSSKVLGQTTLGTFFLV